MLEIQRKKNEATIPSKVVNRGKNDETKHPNYFIKIPTDYPGFDGLCLPLSIILVIGYLSIIILGAFFPFYFQATYIELGKVIKRNGFITKGRTMWNIKSTCKQKQLKACKTLMDEYNYLKNMKYPVLSRIKDHTFKNTCYILARHYQVNA